MHPSTERVVMATREFGLEIEVVTFEQQTRTAVQAAEAVGCDVAQIVKSLCFVVDEVPTMVLVSGANQLDEKKLAGLAGVGRKKVKRADANTVKQATGYSIGGVSPFGHKNRMVIYIDDHLMTFDEVWAAAGTPYTVFRIRSSDLHTYTGGTVADVKK